MSRAKRFAKYVLAATGVLALLAVAGLAYLGYLLIARVEGNYLDADGVRIHYTDEGSGEPVILIHGIGAQADINWRRAGTIDRLKKNFRVIAYDLRGHGLSDKPHEPEAYGGELIEDVRRLMDARGIERAHIAGYSLGGFIALAFVTRYPERALSVAYCASGWVDPGKGIDDIASPYRLPPDDAIVAARNLAFMLPAEQTARWMKDLAEPFVDRLIDKQALKAMKKSYRELVVTSKDLERQRVPSICFIGTRDGLLPYALELHAHLPQNKIVVMEGADHITTAMRENFKSGLRDFFVQHTVK